VILASRADAVDAADTTDSTTLAVFRWAQLGMVLANLARIPVLSTGDREAPVTINEILLGAIILVGLIAAVRRRSLRVDSVAVIAALFALVGAGSALWTAQQYGLSVFELTVSLAYLARWVAYFMLYVVLRASIRADAVVTLWRAVENMLVVFAMFGIVQAAFLPNFAQLVYPDSRTAVDWDVQGHRLVSTVLEPNIAGAMLMIGVLVQLSMISTGARVSRWKLVVLLSALILTVSRSSALGFMIGVVALFAARGLSKRLLRVGAVVGGLFVLALPKIISLAIAYQKFDLSTESSAGARVFAWLRAIRVFSDHPIFGVGFNTYGYVAERYGWERLGAAAYGSDGGLLFIAAMTGLVGLAIYCGMLAMVIRKCRSLWRNPVAPPEHRGLAIGTTAAIVAVVVHSLFVNSILTTYVMEIVWVLWAIVGIAGESAVRTGRRADRIPQPSARLVALEV
jgi:O-antigen ligase